ncbi:MAG TPA: MFS transporter [Noviherbaspirillum sp.]
MTTDSSSSAPAIPALAVPLLSLAAFGSGISLRVTDPMLPHLATEFGVTVGEAAQVITAFSLSYSFSLLIFGPFGDRYGKYLAVGLSAMASALGALLCALAPGYGALVAARMFAGVSAAALIPLSMAWIGDVVPYQQRQAVIARFLIGQVLGLSSGVLLGGLAADVHNWRLPFFLIAIAFVLVGTALLVLNRRLPAAARITHRAEGNALSRSFLEFREVLNKRWARVILLTVFLEGAFLYGAFAFIATHVHLRFGLSLTSAGALVMVFGLGGFVFALASRRLVRLGERRLTIAGGMMVGLSYLAVGLVPAWGWGGIGCFAAGIGFYMMHTTLQANATQMDPARRGAAMSAFACSFFLGQSAGVGLAGVVVSLAGTGAVLLICALGIVVVALRFAHRLKLAR